MTLKPIPFPDMTKGMRKEPRTYDATAECWVEDSNEPHAVVRAYRQAFEAFHGKPAPDVRVSEPHGFYVRAPVSRQFTVADMRNITRFFQKGAR